MNRIIAIIATLATTVVIATGCSNGEPTRESTSEPSPETTTTSRPIVLDAPVTVTGCPTEDSCEATYADGVWTITPIIP